MCNAPSRMTRLSPVFILVFIAIQLFDNAAPKPLFKGISLKRAFDFSFIPLERKPISYIRERWSPFGVFGVRRTIEKRDLSDFKKDPGIITPVTVLPPGHVGMPYLQMTPRPPPPVVETPDLPPFHDINYGTMLNGIAPFPKKYSIPFIFLTTPKAIEMKSPPPGLHTDISRVPLTNHYLKPVQLPPASSPAPTVKVEKEIPPAPSETPPVDEPALDDNSIFPKARLATYFGNVLLKLVSQFFANARYSLSRLVAPRGT